MPAKREDFNDAIAPLATYRRSIAYEYVRSLEAKLAEGEKERSALADKVIELEKANPGLKVDFLTNIEVAEYTMPLVDGVTHSGYQWRGVVVYAGQTWRGPWRPFRHGVNHRADSAEHDIYQIVQTLDHIADERRASNEK